MHVLTMIIAECLSTRQLICNVHFWCVCLYVLVIFPSHSVCGLAIILTSRGRTAPKRGGNITKPHTKWEGDISVLFPIAIWFCFCGITKYRKWHKNDEIITQPRPTDTRKCVMFIKALRTDSTIHQREGITYLKYCTLSFILSFIIAFSTSDIALWLRWEDLVDLQSTSLATT